jgi:hypothetical protein
MRSVRLLIVATAIAATAGIACSGDSLTDINAPLGLELDLAPAVDTIIVTDSIRSTDRVALQLSATSFGMPVQTPAGVEWTSANRGIAVVDSTGVVRPTGFGSTTVTARVNLARATSTIVVILHTTPKPIP